MPIVVIGNSAASDPGAMFTKNIEYKYPYQGVDFNPRSRFHQGLVTKLMQRADESYAVMSRRHQSWRYIDEMMTGFIPVSEYEKEIKFRREARESQFANRNRPISVVVPYSYATFETIMTYLLQAYLSTPLFQYDAAAPEDTIGAKLLELAVDAQVRRFQAALAIRTVLKDCLKYGIGVSTFEWDQQWGKKSSNVQYMSYNEQGQFLGMRAERQTEDALLFEGNRIIPIDPYKFLPDPNVSIDNIQRGEFNAWISSETYYDLLNKEQDDETMFNVRYLDDPYLRQRTSRYTTDDSARERRYGGPTQGAYKTPSTNYVTLMHMFITIIPREWKLPGDPANNARGNRPEKWLFTVANDLLLIRASRHNLNHGMYPTTAAAPDSDGYTITPVSRMEMLHGLQEGMNWLYNSHIANVRKAMNDMLIVDPSLVVMADLRSPEPGKLVRIRKKMWGRGVENAVQQLRVVDVTQQNIGDSGFLADIMQRVSAASDSVQGIVRGGGERRSATEYRTTANAALSRLEMIAKVISMQYISPTGYMMASHTQQFMSKDVYARIYGEWPAVLDQIYQRAPGLVVKPEDLLVDYDVIVKDGSIPTAGAANADLLVQLYGMVLQNPQLTMLMDTPRMYARIATMLGDKNAYEFIRKGGDLQAATVPDEQVQDAVTKGNLVPLPQAA